MGKVMTVLKVFAAEGVTPEQLLEKVKAVEGCNSAKIADYVFGMKMVQASFVCDDSSGKDYEEIVRNLDGVEGVQIDEVGLVS
jgi:translation elongation factor EF-1beta